MEPKSVKALDKKSKVMHSLKRKRASRCASFFAKAPQTMLAEWPAVHSSTSMLSKRRKINRFLGEPVGCGSQCKKSVLQCYSNFSRTGVPVRVFFSVNGEWIDFSDDLIDMVRTDLQIKKAVVEVELEGQHYMLDFLHMCRFDLKTGLQLPIAWIDDAGACFFPETYTDDGELSSLHEYEQDYNGTREIKLQLEIDINGVDQSKEYTGESKSLVKHMQVAPKYGVNHDTIQVEDSWNIKSVGEVVEGIPENKKAKGISASKARSLRVKVDSDSLQSLFINGMTCFPGVEVLDITKCSSTSLEDRVAIFEKQIELTGRCRGDANVRYAWLASSSAALPTMMTYGLGYCLPSATKFSYAVGIHLSAADQCQISASDCDVDENGTRHVIFCRVIMGNMEPLQPGSRQFHPSSEDFDNAVDNLENPRQYIVWNMNVNTHIVPEYVVSFKVSSEGDMLFPSNGSFSFQ
ncbi:Inactive poly [ADP-ribose] polymerase RCD1 [Linum grandiflorum]